MQHPFFNKKPDSRGEPVPLWQRLLQDSPDHYELSRKVEQEQQVYRENRVARHISPHLLDQALSLVRVASAHFNASSGG